MDGGNLDLAEELYRSSVTSSRLVPNEFDAGYGHLGFAEMNLGLLLVARVSYGEAELVFESALESVQEQGVPQAAGVVRAMMLPCAVARGDLESFSTFLNMAEERLTSMFDADAAEPASSAANLASAAGESELAQRAYRLSLAQWAGLGREAEAKAVRKRLQELTGRPEGRPK